MSERRLRQEVESVRELMPEPKPGRSSQPRRRGGPRQRSRLRRERAVRRAAVRYARWCRRHGRSTENAAERVHMCAATLRRWEVQWRRDHLRARPRGRPPERAERWVRNAILGVIVLLGPRVGVPTLRWLFPGVSRGELRELLARYRRVYRRRHGKTVRMLRWTRVGAVWAMDFGNPPVPIDRLYTKILAIRDLASGYQLEALPCPAERVELVIAILDSLVRCLGAPLVLKVDNGASFSPQELKVWAKKHGIVLLDSPPRTPQYNGSIEAGMGSIKVRSRWQAVLQGHPGEWTCDDVQAAVAQANETALPRGLGGATPAEAWKSRIPLTRTERTAFHARYRREERNERRSRGISPWVSLQHDEQASIDRMAIRRTLTALGFLLFRRRRVAPPVFHSRAREIL